MKKILESKGYILTTEISTSDGELFLLPYTTLGKIVEDELSITIYAENDSIYQLPKENIKQINYLENSTEIEMKSGLNVKFNY